MATGRLHGDTLLSAGCEASFRMGLSICPDSLACIAMRGLMSHGDPFPARYLEGVTTRTIASLTLDGADGIRRQMNSEPYHPAFCLSSNADIGSAEWALRPVLQ